MGVEYNRQYVGARYVPQFFNNPDGSWDWAQGFQYEPLTMVKYGENTYTSKMLVPATVGSPNLNPEYWANTGNYNGAINAINEQINNINSKINEIQYKKILIIGDSYNDYPSSQFTTFGIQLKSFLEPMGWTIDIMAKGGAGFVSRAGGNGDNFINLLMNSPQKDYDIILIEGFVNDLQSNSLWKDGMEEAVSLFSTTAYQKYPNAQIIACPTSKSFSIKPTLELRNILKGFCINNKILWWKETYYALLTLTDMLEDGVHPNAIGHNKLFMIYLYKLLNIGFPTITSIYNGYQVICSGDTTKTTIPMAEFKNYLENMDYPLSPQSPQNTFQAQNFLNVIPLLGSQANGYFIYTIGKLANYTMVASANKPYIFLGVNGIESGNYTYNDVIGDFVTFIDVSDNLII